MANLTLTIPSELLREARKLAVDRDTSVNQMVRDFLQSEVRQSTNRRAALERLLGRRYPMRPIDWKRDDLYER